MPVKESPLSPVTEHESTFVDDHDTCVVALRATSDGIACRLIEIDGGKGGGGTTTQLPCEHPFEHDCTNVSVH